MRDLTDAVAELRGEIDRFEVMEAARIRENLSWREEQEYLGTCRDSKMRKPTPECQRRLDQ